LDLKLARRREFGLKEGGIFRPSNSFFWQRIGYSFLISLGNPESLIFFNLPFLLAIFLPFFGHGLGFFQKNSWVLF